MEHSTLVNIYKSISGLQDNISNIRSDIHEIQYNTFSIKNNINRLSKKMYSSNNKLQDYVSLSKRISRLERFCMSKGYNPRENY